MQLRKLEEKDIPYIFEWMSDPSITQYFTFSSEGASEESIKNFVDCSQEFSRDRHYACVDEHDEYLGTISLKDIDTINGVAEYAVSFRAKAQGTGIAELATRELLRIAFEELGLSRIWLSVLENNTRACCFYERLDFKYEGLWRNHIIKGTERMNLRLYSVLKEEWDQ